MVGTEHKRRKRLDRAKRATESKTVGLPWASAEDPRQRDSGAGGPAAKHSWWEETWRWEIALRVLVLSGGQRLETAFIFIFWCAVFGVRRFTQAMMDAYVN